MGYLKVSLFSSLLLVLMVAKGQEYVFEEYDLEPNGCSPESCMYTQEATCRKLMRARRDVGDFIMQRYNEELRENLRYRRDDVLARQRRQGHGGHGGGGGGGHEGVTGPVHTFVKTDEHAHFKWGVRHHVGHEYAGRR